ncbi:hypothetical protein MUP77_09095 [Candidatus Bathyarchaeota archaeon]|nr:hypothetical protein [Candidatus Bathyarchaeota archaeon]
MGEENVSLDKAHKTGSSDMGNVSSMIPTTSAQVGGVMGEGHSKDFKIVDPEKQYIIPSKAMAMMVVELLNNDAAKAKEVMSVLKPKVLKKDYVRT